MTQRSKDIWTLLFSVISFFIPPIGLVISIPTWIISNNSIQIKANGINRSTKILSIISTILSIFVIVLAIVGAMTYYQNK
ncbi:hypothetical protein JI640_14695 [Listeria ivanovii subsp. londoniensis]|nr:hypothetical protein [Listeria seeligeri]MBC2233022.1 hypothetical protein [Listeria seeligeri]MBF2626148.1 hypothetical protein [Listeria seeligeri]MBF2673458.1 hypothetical protein [Listeria seeligeri]MBK1997153.1 hypothetical protein [Listeria ivanovii subsp. londoniensis]